MNKKNGWLFALFLTIGIVLGGFIGTYFANSSYFSWLNFGEDFVFHPAFDFQVIKFNLDLTISLNIASILGILISIFAYRKLR